MSAVCAASFILLLIVAGLFDPSYSQLSESALAPMESSSAPLMIAGDACLGVTAIAAGAALLRSPRGGLARTACTAVRTGRGRHPGRRLRSSVVLSSLAAMTLLGRSGSVITLPTRPCAERPNNVQTISRGLASRQTVRICRVEPAPTSLRPGRERSILLPFVLTPAAHGWRWRDSSTSRHWTATSGSSVSGTDRSGQAWTTSWRPRRSSRPSMRVP